VQNWSDCRIATAKKHGFARNKQFSIVGASISECIFELVSDDETRQQFPFEFVLEVAFVIEGASASTNSRLRFAC
jgi:galactose mutarotase-like enzyme